MICISLLLFFICGVCFVFFFKQKTAYEMRISDWSSDVCSSDLAILRVDDEFRITFVRADDLIDPGGAIALCRLVIERQIIFDRDRGVLELQVTGLILLMIGVRHEHGG